LSDFLHFEAASASRILAWAIETYGESFAIATSFQKEGMVIVDLAAHIAPGVRVFTLDTCRLPAETHRMIETVRERYGIATEIVLPDATEVQEMISIRGQNLFYESVESRLLCCDIRKVRPLERKLSTLRAWATGIRRENPRPHAQG
jgi:3'-phosphoadenosine 5'-phosphosulfate sulfotransferase (PAPS reductase)/FAD synthetase